MQEKFIFINKHLTFLILEGYQRKMLTFFEFYQIIKLFFLLWVNLYRFYQVYNYYAIFIVEVGVASWKVSVANRRLESLHRVNIWWQAIQGDIRLLEPQILESWKSVFRGWPVFRVFHCSSTSYSYVRK